MDEYYEEKFRKALAETNAALANLLVVCENMKRMPVKKEFVVGKWYRHISGNWMQCIFAEGDYGWLRRLVVNDAYRTPLLAIDWSAEPRDEHP